MQYGWQRWKATTAALLSPIFWLQGHIPNQKSLWELFTQDGTDQPHWLMDYYIHAPLVSKCYLSISLLLHMMRLKSYIQIPASKIPKFYAILHYSDVIMSAMASQISGVSIIYSTVCLGNIFKETSKFHVTGLCEGNSPVTDELPAQRTSNAEMFSFDDVIMSPDDNGNSGYVYFMCHAWLAWLWTNISPWWGWPVTLTISIYDNISPATVAHWALHGRCVTVIWNV